jgi:hypothetical protein
LYSLFHILDCIGFYGNKDGDDGGGDDDDTSQHIYIMHLKHMF